MKKQITTIGIVVTGIIFLLVACPWGNSGPQAATIKVEPETQGVNAGDLVTIDINVSDVEDLYGFQLKIVYDPAILSEPRAYRGNFLDEGFATFTDGSIIEDAGNPRQTKLLGASLLGNVNGKDGGGVLLRVTFKAKAAGKSDVGQVNVILKDSNSKTIPANIENGNVEVF